MSKPADISRDDGEEEVVVDHVGNGFTCDDDKAVADLLRKRFIADSGHRHRGQVVWKLTLLGKLAIADEETMTMH